MECPSCPAQPFPFLSFPLCSALSSCLIPCPTLPFLDIFFLFLLSFPFLFSPQYSVLIHPYVIEYSSGGGSGGGEDEAVAAAAPEGGRGRGGVGSGSGAKWWEVVGSRSRSRSGSGSGSGGLSSVAWYWRAGGLGKGRRGQESAGEVR